MSKAKIKDNFQGSRGIVLPSSIINDMEHDEFESKLHITDIGYYPQAKYHYRQRTVGISQYVLIYCIKSKGWYRLRNKTFEVGENCFFILPAHVPHEYGANDKDPWSIYWIHFKGSMAHYFGDDFETPSIIPVSQNSRISDRIAIFEEIYSTLEKGYSKTNLDFAISVLYYFLGSIKFLNQFRNSSGIVQENKSIVESSIRYMRENIEKKIELDDICNFLSVSKSYFSLIFKAETNYSPIEYMIQLKMQLACQLLDFTPLKINQICFKIGISDPYYFSRIFHKIIGKSPAEYRKLKKG
ncbi:MAG: AraC family transcriptional regulator [Muribaculaceae bacterium]|jgi:AraC family transcriptional regulator of arabinose operon|nr:AraC family transcriptional regulator [Muribaculaceae bacterium]